MTVDNVIGFALPFTGERYVPEVGGNIKLEHLHRYLFACQLVSGKVVLDIASGEGYGSARLARTAQKVIGVDASQEAILHAQSKYIVDNLEFRLGSCSAIPIEDATVDVVVSFETIEHHDEHEAMMREIKRVLRPGGVLVISSPDRIEYSDKPGFKNPHHVRELYRHEFEDLLSSYFNHHCVYGQRVVYGSAIFCEDGPRNLETYELTDEGLTASPGVSNAVYLVAVASDSDDVHANSGFLDQRIEEAEITCIWQQQVAARNDDIRRLEKAVAEFEGQVARANQALNERDSLIVELNQKFRKKEIEAYKAQFQLACQVLQKDQVIAERDRMIAKKDRAIAERDLTIKVLTGSRSMRLTRPIRMILHEFRRVKRGIVLIGPAVRHGGGVINSIRKAVRLYRMEGFEGIKHGFRIIAGSNEPAA